MDRGRSRERSNSAQYKSLQEAREEHKIERARSSRSRSSSRFRDQYDELDRLSECNRNRRETEPKKDLRERVVEQQLKKRQRDKEEDERQKNREREEREDREKMEARYREDRAADKATRQRESDEKREKDLKDKALLEQDRDIWSLSARERRWGSARSRALSNPAIAPEGAYRVRGETPRRYHGAEVNSPEPPRERYENNVRVIRVHKRRDDPPSVRSRSATPTQTPIMTPRSATPTSQRSQNKLPYYLQGGNDKKQDTGSVVGAPLPWLPSAQQEKDMFPHGDFMGSRIGQNYRRERSKDRHEQEDKRVTEQSKHYEVHEVRSKEDRYANEVRDRNSNTGYPQQQQRYEPRGHEQHYEELDSERIPREYNKFLADERQHHHEASQFRGRSRTPEPQSERRERSRSKTPQPGHADRYYRDPTDYDDHRREEEKKPQPKVKKAARSSQDDDQRYYRSKAGSERNSSTPALRDILGGQSQDDKKRRHHHAPVQGELWQPVSRVDIAAAGAPSGGRSTPGNSRPASRRGDDKERSDLPPQGHLPYAWGKKEVREKEPPVLPPPEPDTRMPSAHQRRRGSKKDPPMALYDPISHCWKLFPAAFCDDGKRAFEEQEGRRAGKRSDQMHHH